MRVSVGNSVQDLSYDADDTDLLDESTVQPGVVATIEDRPGADFIAAADQDLTVPSPGPP